MKTLLALILLVSFSLPAHANLCVVREGQYWYPRLKSMQITDKAMHCSLSCDLAIKCSRFESWTLGRLKEVFDLFVDEADAEWADLVADDAGISLATSKRALNMKECLRECRKIY